MADRYDSIFSPERKQARRFDTPYRSRLMTDQVYTEDDLPVGEETKKLVSDVCLAVEEAPQKYGHEEIQRAARAYRR